eukprot:scaffold102451_cov52-Prasinocladus_malaysianus.AAC.1
MPLFYRCRTVQEDKRSIATSHLSNYDGPWSLAYGCRSSNELSGSANYHSQGDYNIAEITDMATIGASLLPRKLAECSIQFSAQMHLDIPVEEGNYVHPMPLSINNQGTIKLGRCNIVLQANARKISKSIRMDKAFSTMQNLAQMKQQGKELRKISAYLPSMSGKASTLCRSSRHADKQICTETIHGMLRTIALEAPHLTMQAVRQDVRGATRSRALASHHADSYGAEVSANCVSRPLLMRSAISTPTCSAGHKSGANNSVLLTGGL